MVSERGEVTQENKVRNNRIRKEEIR